MTLQMESETAAVVRDPVCAMIVDPEAGNPTHRHGERVFHFCCTACRDRFAASPEDYLTATDPVTGATVDRATAAHVEKHAGQRFFFSDAGAAAAFAADPDRYVTIAPAPAGMRYTCPMHPEIVEDVLTDCPICGMALEPMVPSLDDGPNPELVDFRRRLWLAGPLAAAIFVLEMGRHLGLPVGQIVDATAMPWLQLALATPVMVIGWPFFERG
ncbi:MAG: YHS domain-containing protein, partial [Pseudomonadota bacterium]